MSRITFIANADIHLVASGAAITAGAAGVTGLWDLNGAAWQTAAALTAADQIQVVQGKGAGEYPLFSQIFDCKGLKIVYTPHIDPVLGKNSMAVATGGVGAVHSFKIVRRVTGIESSGRINGKTDYGRGAQVVHIEYVEVTGDTTTTIANALAKTVNDLGKSYGFLADSTTVPGTIDVYGNTWFHEYEVHGESATLTLTATAKTVGSGNFDQVLSAEQETQAMHGYHSRAGSFLQTPATYTSSAIAAIVPIVEHAAPTAPTEGYDCAVLYVPNSTSGNAAGDASAMTEVAIYFDSVGANNANWCTVLGLTSGTASTVQL